jgi:hypothetical protein
LTLANVVPDPVTHHLHALVEGLPSVLRGRTVPGLREMTSDKMTSPEITWPAGAAATTGTLPRAEILAEVRREGFYPVGRPVRRGRVYVLFAVDQDDFDVQLTSMPPAAGCPDMKSAPAWPGRSIVGSSVDPTLRR